MARRLTGLLGIVALVLVLRSSAPPAPPTVQDDISRHVRYISQWLQAPTEWVIAFQPHTLDTIIQQLHTTHAKLLSQSSATTVLETFRQHPLWAQVATVVVGYHPHSGFDAVAFTRKPAVELIPIARVLPGHVDAPAPQVLRFRSRLDDTANPLRPHWEWAWSTSAQPSAVWGIWYPSKSAIGQQLPAALRSISAVNVRMDIRTTFALHLRLLTLDATAAALATETLNGMIALALLDARMTPWLTPILRSVRVHPAANIIDIQTTCSLRQLIHVLQTLHLL